MSDKGSPRQSRRDQPAHSGTARSRSPTVRRRFDEPFLPSRNYIAEANPGFWADHCKREENIVKRWNREYGAAFRSSQRARSHSPGYRPTTEDPQFMAANERRRPSYNSKAGSCVYCKVYPCCCFTFTYGGSRSDLAIKEESWERLPYGCLQIQQNRGMVSDPGPRMIGYYIDDPLARPPQGEDTGYYQEIPSTSEGYYGAGPSAQRTPSQERF